jgi:K+-sensing histidine kinase KdpD
LEGYARGIPLLILISATILCSLYSGLWLGVGAAIASAIGLNFLFQDPRFALGFYYIEHVIELVAFTLLAVLVSTVGARLRKTKMDADEAIRACERLLAVVSHHMNNPLLAMVFQPYRKFDQIYEH